MFKLLIISYANLAKLFKSDVKLKGVIVIMVMMVTSTMIYDNNGEEAQKKNTTFVAI